MGRLCCWETIRHLRNTKLFFKYCFVKMNTKKRNDVLILTNKIERSTNLGLIRPKSTWLFEGNTPVYGNNFLSISGDFKRWRRVRHLWCNLTARLYRVCLLVLYYVFLPSNLKMGDGIHSPTLDHTHETVYPFFHTLRNGSPLLQSHPQDNKE